MSAGIVHLTGELLGIINLHYALQLGFTMKLMMFTAIQKINPQQDKDYF